MTTGSVNRGDIVLVDFGPGRDHEVGFVRPAVVVTNDNANLYSPSITVVPLTSNTDSVLPFQVLLPRTSSGLDKDSKVQVELVRSIGRSRLLRTLGVVPVDLMDEVDRRLAEHLGLPAFPLGAG